MSPKIKSTLSNIKYMVSIDLVTDEDDDDDEDEKDQQEGFIVPGNQ